jgi:hypothetical protein
MIAAVVFASYPAAYLRDRPAALAVTYLAAVGIAEAGLWWLGRPVVEVRGGRLQTSGASISVRAIGPAEILDPLIPRQALQPGAHLQYRGWVRGGVRVPVRDPRLPAAVLSTRRPAELAAALETARRAAA